MLQNSFIRHRGTNHENEKQLLEHKMSKKVQVLLVMFFLLAFAAAIIVSFNATSSLIVWPWSAGVDLAGHCVGSGGGSCDVGLGIGWS